MEDFPDLLPSTPFREGNPGRLRPAERLASIAMARPTDRPTHQTPPFQPVAAALAWVFPGAGHLFLGHRQRALFICIGILGLFASGLLIGGISVIDRRDNFFWFLGQALVGPITLAVDYAHQNHFKAYGPDEAAAIRHSSDLKALPRRGPRPGETRIITERKLVDGPTVRLPAFRPADPANGERPPYVRSLGRAAELGILFCTIAGFLNLIAMLDAAWRRRADPDRAGGATP